MSFLYFKCSILGPFLDLRLNLVRKHSPLCILFLSPHSLDLWLQLACSLESTILLWLIHRKQKATKLKKNNWNCPSSLLLTWARHVLFDLQRWHSLVFVLNFGGIHPWSLGVALSLCSEVILDDAQDHSLQRIRPKTLIGQCAEPIELSISLAPSVYISIEVPINKHKNKSRFLVLPETWKDVAILNNIPVGNAEQDPRQNTGVVPSLNPPNFIYDFSPRPSSLSFELAWASVGLHTCSCASFPSL